MRMKEMEFVRVKVNDGKNLRRRKKGKRERLKKTRYNTEGKKRRTRKNKKREGIIESEVEHVFRSK